MTRGWFDAFRENGGPTLYSYSNRTAVTADVATLTLYIVFVTLFLAFVIIFPGVRRQRFTTFTSVTLSLFVGTAILGLYNQCQLWTSKRVTISYIISNCTQFEFIFTFIFATSASLNSF